MNHSPADILVKLLSDLSLATVPPSVTPSNGYTAYVNQYPDTPDKLITLYDTDGLNDGKHMFASTVVHPGINMRVRSTTQNLAYVKAIAVLNALDAVNRATVTLDGTSYLIQNIVQRGTLNSMGHDADDVNWSYSANLTVTLSLIS